MKLYLFLFAITLSCAMAGLTSEATTPKADLFETSFESDENPAYPPGTLFTMNGWHRANTTINDAAMIITGGVDGDPAAPHGVQLLKLRNAEDDFGVHRGAPFASLKITSSMLPDRFFFSGFTGFFGDISPQTGIISRFYLSNSEKTEAFMGPAFGIWQEKGVVRFFYIKGPKGVPASFGEPHLAQGKLYRFELDVQVPERSYRIRVYNSEDQSLLGSADDGRFRNDTPIAINYLRLNNLSDPEKNGDDFISYFDHIRFSTTPLFDW